MPTSYEEFEQLDLFNKLSNQNLQTLAMEISLLYLDPLDNFPGIISEDNRILTHRVGFCEICQAATKIATTDQAKKLYKTRTSIHLLYFECLQCKQIFEYRSNENTDFAFDINFKKNKYFTNPRSMTKTQQKLFAEFKIKVWKEAIMPWLKSLQSSLNSFIEANDN